MQKLLIFAVFSSCKASIVLRQCDLFLFSFFQTYLGIKTGQLLEAVMTRMRAILLIILGWTYGTILVIIIIIFPRSEDPYKVGFKCERKAIPLTLVAMPGLFIICSIITIQTQTLLILKSRLNEATRNDRQPALVTRISTGRIRLYKRAMGTAGMIALVYVIGWMPLFVVYTINAWSLGDKDMVDTVLPKFVILAFILQSFSNAIIFRLRNLDKSFLRGAGGRIMFQPQRWRGPAQEPSHKYAYFKQRHLTAPAGHMQVQCQHYRDRHKRIQQPIKESHLTC